MDDLHLKISKYSTKPRMRSMDQICMGFFFNLKTFREINFYRIFIKFNLVT